MDRLPTSENGNSSAFEHVKIELPQKENRKKISVYLFLTVSVALFMMAFSLADFGIETIKSGDEHIMSYMLSSFFDKDFEPLSFSEVMVGNMLGVNNFSLEVPDEKPSADTVKEDQGVDSNTTVVPVDTSDKDTESAIDTEPIAEKNEPVENQYPIQAMNLAEIRLGEYYISNETGYRPDIKALLDKSSALPVFSSIKDGINANEPLVLVLHTHGTEAYMDEGREGYSDNDTELARSTDTNKNIVAVGAAFVEVLKAEGIPTLHCKIMHDRESYQESYSRAAETIRTYLDKYPSIKYVFDIHRDAILKSDGTLVKTVTNVGGKQTAQVMIVVGSDYKGANFPNWEDRLSLALNLRSRLNSAYKDICRPIYLRGAAFNEQYTDGSLLLEIGSSGNTLSEAKLAAEYMAKTIANMIKGK